MLSINYIGRLERWKIKVNTTKTETISLKKLQDIPRRFEIRGARVELRQCVDKIVIQTASLALSGNMKLIFKAIIHFHV